MDLKKVICDQLRDFLSQPSDSPHPSVVLVGICTDFLFHEIDMMRVEKRLYK
jgi:hypothetical protein